METRGDYQADASADEQQTDATPSKVIALRPWAQIEMDMLTLGARCFSLAGTRCLLYLLRYTVGFHTMTVKLTVDEFCHGKRRKDSGRFDEGTDLSRPSVLSGLHELQRAHVIAIANEGHGRGTVATYELFPVECWQVERLNIGKKSLPINDEASIGKDSSPIAASNGKESLPKRRIIGKKSLPHINIEVKDSPEEKNDSDADASADAPKPSTSRSKPKKERRPPTPEEEYRAALIQAIEDVRDGEKAPNHGQEWKAAGDFYRMQAPIETIIACYREEMRRPSWDTKYLSLMTLKSNYGAFVRSGPANYRAGIERARAAVAGKYDTRRQNGRSATTSLPSTIRQLSD